MNINKVPELAKEVKAHAFAIVNTETLMDNIAGDHSTEQLLANPALGYMPESVIKQWVNSRTQLRSQNGFNQQRANQFLEVRSQLTIALHQQGVPVLLGSDAPQIFNVPGR